MILLSIFTFTSFPLYTPGIMVIVAGLAQIYADINKEIGDANVSENSFSTLNLCKKHHKHNHNHEDQESSKRCINCKRFGNYFCHFFDPIHRNKTLVILKYVLINVGLAADALYRWITFVESCKGAEMCPSIWAPYAKMFGQLLNFNCAIILVPVIRKVLSTLNDLEITPKFSVASIIPLKKNIVFHKMIAISVLIATLGHIIFHLLNFPYSPKATLTAFTLYPWITGIIITISMQIIYSGAQNRVRRANYEVFFASHHLFVVFFLFLIAHGPNFYIWCSAPVLLYIYERLSRIRRGNKVIYLQSARYVPPILELTFSPKQKDDFRFKEGQYIYIASPHLSPNQWHPFTISSCHYDLVRDNIVTIHIKVQSKGSWTSNLKDYFSLMVKPSDISKEDGRFYLSLSRYDSSIQQQKGKYLGPDGLPLITIDGPHAAPSQHYSEFAEVMIIGAGIGVTPLSAIMKAILRYKWKHGFTPQVAHFYWIVRHSEIESFHWFIELLYKLSNRLNSDKLSGAITPNHKIFINICVSSVPNRVSRMQGKGFNLGVRDSSEDDSDISNIEVSQRELYEGILNPTQKSKNQNEIQTADNYPNNRFRDIWIWEGRPDWKSIFKEIKNNRSNNCKDIGVVFCGTPIIGADLKRYCHEYSDRKCLFHLYKENF